MISVKYSLLLISVAAVVVAQRIPPEVITTTLQYHNECKEESGIADNVVMTAMMGNFPDDPAFRRHIYCMSKKMGFQNDDGEIQEEVLKEKLGLVIQDPEKVDDFTAQCAIQQDDPEDTAVEMAKCYYSSIRDIIMPGK